MGQRRIAPRQVGGQRQVELLLFGLQSALGEFEKVVTVYPDSSKVADAKLKMGYIRYELKDWDKARELLNQVVQSYPGSTSARLAQERLERMASEGH